VESKSRRRMRVFLVEGQSALDMLNDQSEAATLRPICRLLGHDFASAIVRSNDEFATAVRHITSMNEAHVRKSDRGLPLCLHLAAHGDRDGLAIGADDATWEFLAGVLRQFSNEMSRYSGPLVLVISSCQAERQRITSFFANFVAEDPEFRPPMYVVTTLSNDDGKVYWQDSVVAWSIFYHQTGEAVLSDREEMQTVIDKVALAGVGALKYFRWVEKDRKYKTYTSELKEHSLER